jgi:hypothetical protein
MPPSGMRRGRWEHVWSGTLLNRVRAVSQNALTQVTMRLSCLVLVHT